jgi:ubiquinone biosynthesis protein UbiJ
MQTLPAPVIAAINHLLGQAAWAREKLAPFAGHSALIKLPPFEAAFLIGEDGCISPASAAAELEVSISLPAETPLLALQGKDAVMRAARIEGSAEFAEALAFVIRNLRWDAEEDLSGIVGDIAAHREILAGADEQGAIVDLDVTSDRDIGCGAGGHEGDFLVGSLDFEVFRQGDVAVAQLVERARRAPRQLLEDLHGVHVPAEAGEQRGLVAAARAHLEHLVGGAQRADA